MKKVKKIPLREALVERGLCDSRLRAEAIVASGRVRVNGEVVTVPHDLVLGESQIEVDASEHYVSRGAFKLLGAFERWGLDVAGKICCDVGSSTGGFTQVLLEKGASKVFAIDVGANELAWSIRKDSRVIVMERTNARKLERLPELVSFVSIDVSFIGLAVILKSVKGWFDPSQVGDVVALVKPQFEAARDKVPEGGVVNDPAVHEEVLVRVLDRELPEGFLLKGIAPAWPKGRSGNQEFLAHLQCAPITAQTDPIVQPIQRPVVLTVELVAEALAEATRKGGEEP